MTHSDIFKLNDWNKDNHEERFKTWIKALTDFDITKTAFKRNNEQAIRFANKIRISELSDNIEKSINVNVFKSKDGLVHFIYLF